MPTAEARIDTTRARRYLAQLSDHLGRMRRAGITSRHGQQAGPHERPAVHQAEHGDRYGEFVFDWGTCKLLALDDALIIRADAADEEDLKRAQAMIGHRIKTIGRREHLKVTWQ
jgi:hypothetical protein